jgi:hypothetical protein
MWKLQNMTGGKRVLLRLSGRIQEHQVSDLQTALNEAGLQNVVLDLADTQLVDEKVVAFLAQCETAGMHLRDCPVYIRDWIMRVRASGAELETNAEM